MHMVDGHGHYAYGGWNMGMVDVGWSMDGHVCIWWMVDGWALCLYAYGVPQCFPGAPKLNKNNEMPSLWPAGANNKN